MIEKLFLVDSDQVRRSLFEGIFKERIYTLANYDDALFRIKDFSPQVILMGTEVGQGLSREQVKEILGAEIPLVFIGTLEEFGNLEQNGCYQAYLKKPISPLEVEREIEKILFST